jgi:hypothetical protein
LKSQGNFTGGNKRGKEGKKHEARGGRREWQINSSKLKAQRKKLPEEYWITL